MLDLSPRVRRIIKWVGYPLFTLVVFIICIYVTFPYDRVKSVVEDHLAASGTMRVSIGECSASPMLGLTFRDIKLTIFPKPTMARFGAAARASGPAVPKRPTIVRLERVTVSVGLGAILGSKTDLDFEVEGLGGELSGHYEAQRKVGYAIALKVKDVKLERVPQARAALGLPVAGRISGAVKLTVPRGRLGLASGAINLTCEGCAVGDGKAKLKVPGNALLAMGITLPRVRLGRLTAEVRIDKGRATFDNVSSRSPDGEINLEGSMTLRTPMAYATMDAYLKFSISAALKRRDAKFELVTNGLAAGKRTDGFYGMRLTGPLRTLRPVPSRHGLRSGGGRGAAGGRRGGVGGRRRRGGLPRVGGGAGGVRRFAR